MFNGTNQHTIREIENLKDFIKAGYSLSQSTFQNIDFRDVEINWQAIDLEGCCFMGCSFNPADIQIIMSRGGILFPEIKTLPYNPYRSSLYTWQELAIEKGGKSYDLNIYEHFSAERFAPSINEALFQRIHDHAIDDALKDYLDPLSDGTYKKKCVGIMGGHGTLRTDPNYSKVALTAQLLSQKGYLVVSGGGPGIMEASNLGAYMAKYSEADLLHAIDLLSKSPHYTDAGYAEHAIEVLNQYPNGVESLAIPTWFYGHEPSNVFASHIAKYFSNSIREDNLLALCLDGILFAKGSAGTTQEIFQDAAQNHYSTYGYISPMIFLGKDRYEKETSLFKTLQQLAEGQAYKDYLFMVDTPQEAVDIVVQHPPIKV